jgi:hypothetical protein
MMRAFHLPLCLVLTLLALAGCRGAQTGLLVDIQGQTSKTLTVTSGALLVTGCLIGLGVVTTIAGNATVDRARSTTSPRRAERRGPWVPTRHHLQ